MAAGSGHNFAEFFAGATGERPFPFQERFARDPSPLVNIPTGLGKTAMAIIAWVWRRYGAGEAILRQTPRRLIYCLPMRVLVEQTRDNAIVWLKNLRTAGLVAHDVPVCVLMGGVDEDDWDIHPEREAIIIGTQDMLLSRALNRGYAASRSRWPMQFGLLHSDSLWVFDEIQLMGSGLATTAQLEAFRRLLPQESADTAKNRHGCQSVWMSATLRPEWLKTVDFKENIDDQGRVDAQDALSLADADHANEQVSNRWNAKKPVARAANEIGDPAALAAEVRQAHRPGTRTIVVVNTVRRACDLFEALERQVAGASGAGDGGSGRTRRKHGENPPDAAIVASTSSPKLVLLHSRFRPSDRQARVDNVLADPPAEGTIIVSTQVIEAGVDVSATTLFTELAPWASLVQRIGRCNRRGEENQDSCVRWIDVPNQDAAPYDPEDMKKARETLEAIGQRPEAQRSVSLAALSTLDVKLSFTHTHVVRRRDLIDLFDTTPDLAGNDIDIDRFVREVEDSDVRVFWRVWDRPRGHEAPPADEPAPRREELSPAPIGAFRDFAKKQRGEIWRWSFLEEMWEKVDAAGITPGQLFLVHADAGGYSEQRGWTGNPADKPTLESAPALVRAGRFDGNESDANSRIGVWQLLAQHTDEVSHELEGILAALKPGEAEALRIAVRWHDCGKAHEVFQAALPDGIPDATKRWAKAVGRWKRYGRRHFRHELASALAVLQRPHDTLRTLSDEVLTLVAYLVAAHHGKVRLSIRSLPKELRPRDGDGNRIAGCRFARGVWDGDTLPVTDLGSGISAPAVTLSLEPMELGLCEQPPFTGQPSWAERMLRLRDALGPFHLAYLEAILRAADMRASKTADQRAATGQPVGGGAGAKEADHG
jgi:CRISPR-associated endonuclease/helicase Cas3